MKAKSTVRKVYKRLTKKNEADPVPLKKQVSSALKVLKASTAELSMYDLEKLKAAAGKRVNPNKIATDIKRINQAATAMSKSPVYVLCGDFDDSALWVSTGCDVLNLDLSGSVFGGFQAGRVAQISGLPSSYKSALAYAMMALGQSLGYFVYFCDTEGTYNSGIAAQYGLDIDNELNFRVSNKNTGVNTIEKFFDVYLKGILAVHSKSNPALIVLDTLTALGSEIGKDKPLKDVAQIGIRARQIARGFENYAHLLADNGVTLICVDQVKDSMKPKKPYQQKHTMYVTNGGHSVGFTSTQKLWVDKSRDAKDASGKVIGVWVKYVVTKNKNIPCDEKGLFFVKYGTGIDNVMTNLLYIKRSQLGDEKMFTPGATFKLFGKAGTLKAFTPYIVSNGLQEALRDMVEALWIQKHTIEEEVDIEGEKGATEE